MELFDAVKSHFNAEVCTGKGGFFVRGYGFISTSKARKLTGIKAETRQPRQVITAYGDYATIAMINRVKT